LEPRGYKLQNELYMVNKRVCRIYIPPMVAEGVKYYWVRYEDNLDVGIVSDKNLTLLGKNAKLLYGKNKV